MKLASVQSLKESIARGLQQTRQQTWDLLIEIDPALFYQQAHPEFSPIGWHFGHIAFTEAHWILKHLADQDPGFPKYQLLFAADGLPKSERQKLPSLTAIKEYLQIIRERTLNYLEYCPLNEQERLWCWLMQHETQHCETISLVWQLHLSRNLSIANLSNSKSIVSHDSIYPIANSDPEMVKVTAGEFVMGCNLLEALDNEQPAHKVHLDDYWIDRFPVTCEQYSIFMKKGGYQKRKYWSEVGWHWLQENPVAQPLYWSESPDWLAHPVYGVSYYEAEAYANFVGKRLPTEAEWEKAAQGASTNCNHSRLIGHTTPVNTYREGSIYGCRDMLGNVWEWTASWFGGYPQFDYYPYPGYSEVYFDEQHRVLRGGSWATNSLTLRSSFRNWYHPSVRQIFAGFRCAMDN
ncbi:MAG: SUMF1/EgtB/PvdO family nonheme iron enzyme [Cyanobacteria bacterium P01_G01_bin.39]